MSVQDAHRAQCRSCSAAVYWVITADKKRMPVNAEPDPMGGFVIALRAAPPAPSFLEAEAFNPAEHHGRKRYTSHFATCAHAAFWRKPKEPS